MAMADSTAAELSRTSQPRKRRRFGLTAEQRQAKRELDRQRDKTRVNLGRAFLPWRELRNSKGFQSDMQLAFFLLDNYLRTKSEKRPERALDKTSSTETSESVHVEYLLTMSSPNEVEMETCAASSVKPSENGKESEKKDAARQKSKVRDERTTTDMSESKESRDTPDDENEEFSTTLSVGDGRYLVDLGSSSEFVVDEECILQLFKSCRKCNRQCSVRKHAKGLKLVVYQSCLFCNTCCKWTNLPDDDDFQIDGQKSAQGQTNSAVTPNSNAS